MPDDNERSDSDGDSNLTDINIDDPDDDIDHNEASVSVMIILMKYLLMACPRHGKAYVADNSMCGELNNRRRRGWYGGNVSQSQWQ